MPNSTRFAQCKRCGSQRVAWAQSTRTGRYYLAFATEPHGAVNYGAVEGPAGGGTSITVHPQTPHKCDDRKRGGYDACPHCAKHHVQITGVDNCARYA